MGCSEGFGLSTMGHGAAFGFALWAIAQNQPARAYTTQVFNLGVCKKLVMRSGPWSSTNLEYEKLGEFETEFEKT
jgi:hypothetical protein